MNSYRYPAGERVEFRNPNKGTAVFRVRFQGGGYAGFAVLPGGSFVLGAPLDGMAFDVDVNDFVPVGVIRPVPE